MRTQISVPNSEPRIPRRLAGNPVAIDRLLVAADQLISDLALRSSGRREGGTPNDDEMIRCYQQCDLFALPNRQVGWDIEGFGIVLIEAQACGKAVVAGSSGGTREAVEAGRTGEIVDCESPETVADVVSTLLDNPDRRASLGSRGRQWVLDRFDWSVLNRKAAQLLVREDPRPGHAGPSIPNSA